MSSDDKTRAGSRMSYWIASALQEGRSDAGIEVPDLARALRVNDRTIKRLEAGRGMGRDIDRFVAAYAYLLGLDDGRELWCRALNAWQAHGVAPEFKPIEGPAMAFAQAIRDAALRQPRDAPERSGTPPSIRTRRAAG